MKHLAAEDPEFSKFYQKMDRKVKILRAIFLGLGLTAILFLIIIY